MTPLAGGAPGQGLLAKSLGKGGSARGCSLAEHYAAAYGLLYLHPPKTGGTSVESLLGAGAHPCHSTAGDFLACDVAQGGALPLIATVRDPFRRLLSLYEQASFRREAEYRRRGTQGGTGKNGGMKMALPDTFGQFVALLRTAHTGGSLQRDLRFLFFRPQMTYLGYANGSLAVPSENLMATETLDADWQRLQRRYPRLPKGTMARLRTKALPHAWCSYYSNQTSLIAAVLEIYAADARFIHRETVKQCPAIGEYITQQFGSVETLLSMFRQA